MGVTGTDRGDRKDMDGGRRKAGVTVGKEERSNGGRKQRCTCRELGWTTFLILHSGMVEGDMHRRCGVRTEEGERARLTGD